MRGGAPGGVGLWGYLLHLRASDRLLLIVDCPSRGALDAASRHAALAYLERRPSRHAHCCRPPCGAWCLFPSVSARISPRSTQKQAGAECHAASGRMLFLPPTEKALVVQRLCPRLPGTRILQSLRC